MSNTAEDSWTWLRDPLLPGDPTTYELTWLKNGVGVTWFYTIKLKSQRCPKWWHNAKVLPESCQINTVNHIERSQWMVDNAAQFKNLRLTSSVSALSCSAFFFFLFFFFVACCWLLFALFCLLLEDLSSSISSSTLRRAKRDALMVAILKVMSSHVSLSYSTKWIWVQKRKIIILPSKKNSYKSI